MNLLEKFVKSLQINMETPKPYGAFHLITMAIVILLIVLMCFTRKWKSEKILRISLALYGFTSLIFEIMKQLILAMGIDGETNLAIWEYMWYAFPFQFCSTPMYAACIACFLKDNKVRKALLSYMSFFTILASVMVMLIPTDIYQTNVIINIHTTILHAGGILISLFLLIHKYVEPKFSNLLKGLIVFIICVIIAQLLNVIIYKSGILDGQTFDMFFISPYFETGMPVFSIIEKYVNDILYVVIYIFAFLLGSSFVFSVAKLGYKN